MFSTSRIGGSALSYGSLMKGLRESGATSSARGGFSQERLAELCGKHRNYVGAVERADRILSIVAADKVARALGTTLSSLFSELERE